MNREFHQSAALQILKQLTHTILNMSMRLGKTKIVIDFLNFLNPTSVLWVCPNVKVRDGGTPQEFDKWDKKDIKSKTKFICWGSLHKENLSNYEIVILDEIHKITPANAKSLVKAKSNLPRVIGLTGTMPTNQEKLEILWDLGLFIGYKVSVDDAVEAEAVADYKIKVIKHDMDTITQNIKAGSKDKPFMQSEMAGYSYRTRRLQESFGKWQAINAFSRMRYIHTLPSKENIAQDLATKLTKEKKRFVVFCGTIAQAERLSKYTFHSKSKGLSNLDRFQSGEINELAVVDAIDAGYTFTDLDAVIMVAANSSSISGPQKFTRCMNFRKGFTAMVYIICTNSTPQVGWIETALTNFKNVEYVQSI